jgi:replicative DNA helicase
MKKEKKESPPSLIDPAGRLLPQSVELEGAVIGALLLESKAFYEIEGLIGADDFYRSENGKIFSAISVLAGRRSKIDAYTVSEELRRSGELESCGGPYYLAGLIEKIASSAHILDHIRYIREKSMARKLIVLSNEIQHQAFDGTSDVREVIEYFEKEMTGIASYSSGNEPIGVEESLKRAFKKAEKIQSDRQSGIIRSITTGMRCLDMELNGGWKSPDLIVIGARPSMGKTQLALHFAKHASLSDKEVLFISIEMSNAQLMYRYLLEDESISNYNLQTGRMTTEEWAALDRQAGILGNMKIHIADSPGIRHLVNIKSEARRLKRRGKLDLMVIDYLGLIRTNMKFERRQLEIGHITGDLKNLAKELDIPIILLSQLSRPQKATAREAAKKEPDLESLRESGDIEQDADTVLFIHRPSFYDPEAIDSDGNRWEGRGKIIISKYREGARNNTVIFHHDANFKKIWGSNSGYNDGMPF